MISSGRIFITGLAVVVLTAAEWAAHQEQEVKLTVLGGLALVLLVWAQQNIIIGDNESVDLALSVTVDPQHQRGS